MRLYQSKVLNNLDKFRCNPGYAFNLMRDHEGIYVMWKLIEYFQPKSILEIGFGCGQTLGLIIEATNEYKRVVSVDIDYVLGKENFENLFPDHTIDFMKIDSRHLNLKEQFDFIFIDGDHSYDGATADIKTCLPLLHKNSILCVDDYHMDDVDQAIKDHLLGSDFVPFLHTGQQIYFHHIAHSVEDFLDIWLMENSMHFLNCQLREYHTIPVLYAHLDNIMFIKDPDIFKLALKFFNQ